MISARRSMSLIATSSTDERRVLRLRPHRRDLFVAVPQRVQIRRFKPLHERSVVPRNAGKVTHRPPL
jgi:hypothetical protein